jgi:hypothetical protein
MGETYKSESVFISIRLSLTLTRRVLFTLTPKTIHLLQKRYELGVYFMLKWCYVGGKIACRQKYHTF